VQERIVKTAVNFGAGSPGRDIWVTLFPGFAYPSGELQPGLLHEQALRAVCNIICLLNRLGICSTANNRLCKRVFQAVWNIICLLNRLGIRSTANNRLCKQPGGPVHVIAQAEAPRRGKRSQGIASPTHTVPEGRHQSQLPF